jgi:hypothetical protein
VGWHLLYATAVTSWHYAVRRAAGHRPALSYTAADIAEEIFVHHLTRYAVLRALKERWRVVYAGFYAYDETAHAFGPDDRFSEHMLRHLDHTLQVLFEAAGEYEVVVLSDHGQTPGVPFPARAGGKRLHELVSELVPGYEVRDLKGKRAGPRREALDGHLVIAASGGLAHLYLAEAQAPLDLEEVERRCPGLVEGLFGNGAIHFVVARRDDRAILLDADGERPLRSATSTLDAFGDASILACQLDRLASFETAGDLILVGRFEDGRQVDFEAQRGAHGSLGGEQCHPFLLARSELGLDVSRVTDASELHALLRKLVP